MASLLLSPQNSEEKLALVQFREEIQDLSLDNDVDDHFLLRWLRARDLNVDKAKYMLSNYLEFMENYEGNKGIEDWIPPPILTNNINLKYIGTDVEGRPVVWLPVGRLDAMSMLKGAEESDCYRYIHQLLQQSIRVIEEQKKLSGATQFVSIVDMDGFSYRKFYHMRTLQFVMSLVKEYEAYYPEILFKAVLVNAPRTFNWLFAMVKPFLSLHTQQKMEIYTCDRNQFEAALRQYIPSTVLPIEYGGTGKAVFPETSEE